MFLNRSLERSIQRVSGHFPVLLLTGPRQVGKTTLLANLAGPDRGYISLDDLDARQLAQQDPALFLQRHPAPVIIDEVQYAPELFSQIKLRVDQQQRAGDYWLTGSQKFHLMQGITESLAGRVAVIDMLGFSQAEADDRAGHSQPFLPTRQWLEQASTTAPNSPDVLGVYQRIWRGAFPQMVLGDLGLRDLFYSSYLQTYVQRDVRALTRVGDEVAFQRMLRATAARSGLLLNYADLARDVDVDQKTAKAWLSILETSGLVYLLQPYHSNVTKRLVKTPKLYFLDTGLAAYLTRWSSPETLEAGAMSGAMFETWAFAEILKSWWHNGRQGNFYFYRDRDQREIDLLIEQDQRLYPIEFKKSATPSRSASRHFTRLDKLPLARGEGAVVCLRQSPTTLAADVLAVPATWL